MPDETTWVDDVRSDGLCPIKWVEAARSLTMSSCKSLTKAELTDELDRWSTLASEAAVAAEKCRANARELEERLRTLEKQVYGPTADAFIKKLRALVDALPK